jgi:hypothetical protein
MKPPRAKVIRMHKLLDEALGLWPDVRTWVDNLDDDDVPSGWFTTVTVDGKLQDVVEAFRVLRHEVEQWARCAGLSPIFPACITTAYGTQTLRPFGWRFPVLS